MPMISGARTRQESHAYESPPHVIGIRKLVVDPMKRIDPIQSTLLSLSASELTLKASTRVRGTRTRASPTNGPEDPLLVNSQLRVKL